jgi:hypothetical protein
MSNSHSSHTRFCDNNFTPDIQHVKEHFIILSVNGKQQQPSLAVRVRTSLFHSQPYGEKMLCSMFEFPTGYEYWNMLKTESRNF